MVVGWDPSEQVAIDKAIDAGIPVVCVDADVPHSKRMAFIGTDWYQLGVEQAKALAPYLKGKTGKAVMIGIAGLITPSRKERLYQHAERARALTSR